MIAAHLADRIPHGKLSRAVKLSAPSRAGKAISLINAMKVKLACTGHLPTADAFSAYAELMGLDEAIYIRNRPIRGLAVTLEAEGEVLAVLEPGARGFTCRPPKIVGIGESPALNREKLRRVLAGRIDNAIVHSRTGAFMRNGELIMDIQRDELEGIPTELSFDPIIFDRQNRMAICLEDAHPERLQHFPKAWSLLGINAVSFGHWMVEQMLQFIAGMDLPEFQGVPLLVDKEIPSQHLQSLKIIGGGRFKIIEVARGERIVIDSLYIITNFALAPHLVKTDQGLDSSYVVGPMDVLAQCFIKGAARFDVTDGTPAQLPTGKLFWARVTDRHRKIENHEVIESYISDVGCEKCYPEQLGFAEQIHLIRGANRIVVQNGSASHAIFFARPGTEVVMLSHPALPHMALYAEILAQLGIDFTVVTGPFSRKGQVYLDQSDYEVPLENLTQVIGHWAG